MDYSYSNQLHSQKRSGFIAISPSQTPGSSEKSGRELRSVDRTLANKHDKDKGVNIQVLLRCRPLSDDEMGVNMPVVISCNEQRREVSAIQHNANKQIDKTFAFDKVFGPTFQQKDLYDQAISPIVNETLEGYNCTIFAYGQTGTGKTYTMEGGGTKTKNGELPHDAGVIPRAVKQIFDILEAQNNDYNMKVTFLELYNEEITDLLAPDEGLKLIEDKAKKPIALMEDGKGSVFVRGLEEEIVTTADEIYRILDKGSSKRRTAETLLNKHGSRSHTIFSITIHIKECTPEGEELIRCGKLNLVDLAGSENILRSGAREGRAREAGEINKSLLTLGRVINALVEHSSHIPYRDSKLTRLLRDSLGGKTKTCIIATISPSTYCLDETLNTLDYAFRAKNIKNKPEVNQKLLKSALIKDLYSEIDRLKQELNAAREKNGIYIPRDRYMHEESKKKAMVEKMEQMEQDSEMKDKQIIELQELYDVKTQLAANLSDKLEETEIVLEETKHSLCDLEEKYRKAKTAIKKKEYYITNLLQSEKALYDYAFELHLELEHAASDVSGLFTKIERKDKLEDGNRTLVHKFCSQLTRQLELLQETVATSVTQQEHHLKRMEGDIHSFVSKKSEAAEEVREQVRKLKTICNARIRDLDDLAVELDSNSQSTFGKLNSEASLHLSSLNDLFKSITVDANVILNEIQSNLSDQVEKLTAYAQQQQEGYFRTLETTRSISEIAAELFNTLGTHAYQLNQLVEEAQVIHNQELHEFEKKFEEHSAIEKQKLLEKVAEMLASVNSKNKKMVQTTVNSLRQSAANRTNQLQQRISTAQNFTFSFKDQWTGHMKETENRYLADIAAVKIGFHNMEGALRHCMLKAGVSAQQWKNAQESLLNLEKENVASMNTIARDGIEANQILRSRLSAAASSALEDFESASNSFLSSIDYSLKLDDDSYKNIDSMTGFCCMELRDLCSCHYHKVMEIGENAEKCLEVEYMLDEPSCSTPTKKSFDLPSIESIEELRTPSYEELMKSFRDEDSSKQAIVDAKDFFPGSCEALQSIPDSRSPLTAINDCWVGDLMK